ncbi:rhodanese-like domain-containing protein [Vagococcus lutrae]|uniref:Rhodanese family protein n=1 Tax=Vagococcus lutrae LBD1 TaxID=1408226 RepID=V6Q425_9ENTE|nr:rhodanese-like domain-containing protein [Vagococcus lutrae]EST89410.1 rhodanese family protein [Vagococcus lutrae LBD1]NKZ27495.1 rhodanese-like domain-containing protein [Vagococcus lutrae]
MSPLLVFNLILLAILVYLLGREGYLRIMARRSAKWIDEAEFKEKMRFSQVIDVREKDVYDSGHILGARNVPYTTLKQSYMGLRKDQDLLIYDQKKTLSIRTANFLRKKGYTNLYILKGGYQNWTGKIKSKNK